MHASFMAWRQRTIAKQQAEQLRRTAIRHFYMSTTSTCLQAWQQACDATRVDQQQQYAAQQHHKARLLTAAFQVWHMLLLLLLTCLRVKGFKQAFVTNSAVCHMALQALQLLAGWLSVFCSCSYTALANQLKPLHQTLSCMQLTTPHSMLSSQAWHGPVMQHLRHKHQQQAAADALAQHHKRLRALSAWAAVVTAGQQMRTRLAAARQFRAHHLLRLSLQGFLALRQEVQQERTAVTAAAAPAAKALAVHKQRHLLQAWLAAAKEQQSWRAQVRWTGLWVMKLSRCI